MCLSSKSVALTDDDGGSATDLLNKLSQQINDLHGQGLSDGVASEGTGYYTEDSMVQLPDRATPFEVWKSKQGLQGKRRPKMGETVTFGPPGNEEEGKVVQILMAQERVRIKLSNGIVTDPIHIAQINEIKAKKLLSHEHDELVQRLHGTKRFKDSAIKQQQNQELAEELRELKFKPTLNAKSMELAKQSGSKKMVDRLKAAAEEKEKKLKDQRERIIQQEVAEVMPHPPIISKKKSESLRQKKGPRNSESEDGGKKTREQQKQYANAMLQFGEETKLRRLQRMQIMEEAENRELTFRPQLNRESLQMTEKNRRSGAHSFDVHTGQTASNKTVVKGGKGTHEDPGHEEELFEPQISGRRTAHPAKVKESGAVHERLYSQAQKSLVDKHNQHVEILNKHMRDLPLKVIIAQ